MYSSVINKEHNDNICNNEEFSLVRRITQRVRCAPFLANIVQTIDWKVSKHGSLCFEEKKHHEDQAAMNVDGRSLISLMLTSGVIFSDVSKKRNSVML